MKEYIFRARKNLFIYLLICFVGASFTAGVAFLYKNLTNYALDKDFHSLIKIAIFAIPFLILEASFDYLPRKYRSILTNNIIFYLRNDLIKKVDSKPISDVNLTFRNEFKNKMINDLETIKGFLNNIFAIILYFFMFIISLISALYIEKTLTLIMLLLSFIPFLSPFISRKILSNKKEKEIESKNKYLDLFNEFNTNTFYIKISNLGDVFYYKLKKLAYNLKNQSIIFESSLAKTYATSYGLGNILYSGTWIVGGIFVYKDLINLPSLIAMTTLMTTIAGPIQSVADTYSEIISAKNIFLDYIKYLDRDNFNENGKHIDYIDSISFNNIDIYYSDRLIIKKLNLELKDNTKYLILGDSGSGKSTFLHLILGLFKDKNKYIYVNDSSLDKINRKSYYDKIYYIPQETIIFNASLIDNISLFDENKDYKRAEAILDKVGLIYLLDDRKLDIIIDYSKLSGGEKKRLDLARALYKNKDILIMDEVTSGLDIKNENIIGDIIKRIKDKTIICVSHSKNEKFLQSFDKSLKIENKELKFF
ncbi:ABC transporter ATP-binding protein [Anaerococcus porci]|uniref:ABC transporter ATP-binding protein n=1 Tax=Anaerococcus porci TaxID=2652269 RepID=UPI002A750B75|nr:ABC transporter ATP-binding protein [Anaerococcus porci]MDY3007071.1 ABC transporter ATP-binding protein [Anaerococcus porci]